MQAQKALNRSNRVMGGSIMVGVSPCTDTAIMEQDAANASCLNASVNQSHVAAAETSIMTLNSSIGGSQLNRSIRPMTQAYKTAQSENQVRSPFLICIISSIINTSLFADYQRYKYAQQVFWNSGEGNGVYFRMVKLDGY